MVGLLMALENFAADSMEQGDLIMTELRAGLHLQIPGGLLTCLRGLSIVASLNFLLDINFDD